MLDQAAGRVPEISLNRYISDSGQCKYTFTLYSSIYDDLAPLIKEKVPSMILNEYIVYCLVEFYEGKLTGRGKF